MEIFLVMVLTQIPYRGFESIDSGFNSTDGFGPEFWITNVTVERLFYHVFAAGASGQTEEGFVAFEEGGPLFLEFLEECRAEQEPKGVGEVVEREVGDEEVKFGRPEERIFSAFNQSIAEDFTLGFHHQFFDATHGDGTRFAFVVEFGLELETDWDIEQEGGRMGKTLLDKERPLSVIEGGIFQQAVGQDTLGERRGGFSQRHGVILRTGP